MVVLVLGGEDARGLDGPTSEMGSLMRDELGDGGGWV